MSTRELLCVVAILTFVLGAWARHPTDLDSELLTSLNVHDARLYNAWKLEEGSDPGCWNPLNTTRPPGRIINSHGVRCYDNAQQGLQATKETLSLPYYVDVVAALQNNDQEAFLVSLANSPWGTNAANVRQLLGTTTSSATQAYSTSTGSDNANMRASLVAAATALIGIPYVRGGRSADGGDCSGTMQFIYKQVTGRDIGATTYSQQANLEAISQQDLEPGDLWYGQYSDDQHTGMVADVDGDGKWDLINNGGLADNMHIDYDMLSIPYLADNTMSWRRAL